MKDQNTKKLMEESLRATSDDFTDNLMAKIDQQHEKVTIPSWLKPAFFILMFTILVSIFMLSSQIRISSIAINLQLEIPKLPVFLVMSIFLFLTIYKFLLLKKNLTRFNRI